MPSALVPWPQTSFFPGVSTTVQPPVESIRLPPKSQAAFISKPGGKATPLLLQLGAHMSAPRFSITMALQLQGPALGENLLK